MLNLLERTIEALDERLVLIAPPSLVMTDAFRQAQADPTEHRRLIRDVQRLRARVYLQDGAVQPHQLTPDGLHKTPEDERSLHVVFRDKRGELTACGWFLVHPVEASFEDLRVRKTPLAGSPEWLPKLWYAVEGELARARAEGLCYAEIGGWAVAQQNRCSSEGLILALSAYSLGAAFGGALGMTTATVRHSSSTILSRIGCRQLHAKNESIPQYYDPRYECAMEILRFDSRQPNPKYASVVNLLRRKLSSVPVITDSSYPALRDQSAVARPSSYVA